MKEFNIFTFSILMIVYGACVFFIGYTIRKFIARKQLKSAEEKARSIVEEAKKLAENRKKEVELEAKDLLFKLRQDFENQTKDRRQEINLLEKRLHQKEENLDRKVDLLDKKDRDLQQREKAVVTRERDLEAKQKELENLLLEERQLLQRLSGISMEEAKKLLLSRMESEIRQEASVLIKRIEDEARESADKKAREIISLAIQRMAAEHTVESTVSVVNLPSDDMKGRIIGREGRNIRAFEVATGVDVIVDDTPEAVILSGFDPIRREIAKISLERLIVDGRIHPARIEEVVDKVKKEMENSIREEGEKAVFELGLHGVHSEVIKLLGRLKYRVSYGQNALMHSKEVANFMSVMAGELGLDSRLAKHIGLLHDIGKAVSHEVEGTHAKIGVDLLKKYSESEAVIHAVEAHHEDVEARSIFAVLLQAADAISASRPGARAETLEAYIKRLEKLEQIADSFKGVEKAYAIQAGREIRVMVQPDKVNDNAASALAREITKKIEEGLEYPGQIKVTVIREVRAVEYAK
ncbi:MAG: ribonuclease Y [Candidatus Omnitrophica bacterium]|nr:ribonuclease Y [Candidatus Omnitrophota bacterium]